MNNSRDISNPVTTKANRIAPTAKNAALGHSPPRQSSSGPHSAQAAYLPRGENKLGDDSSTTSYTEAQRVRDVAVFLADLPQEQLTQILAQLPLDQAQKISQAITGLGSISDAERSEVIQRFSSESGIPFIAESATTVMRPVADSDAFNRQDPPHTAPISQLKPGTVLAAHPRPHQLPSEMQWAAQQADAADSSAEEPHLPATATRAIPFVEADDELFSFCEAFAPDLLGAALKLEDPLSIALVLAEINREQAAAVLTEFDIDWRMAIVRRMANLEMMANESRREIADRLRQRLLEMPAESGPSGFEAVAEILSELDSPTRQTLLDCLAISDLSLARRLSQECRPLTDLLLMSDDQVKQLLHACDLGLLALALVDVDQKIQRRIYQNMATQPAKLLRQAVEDGRQQAPEKRREASLTLLKWISKIRKQADSQAA